jgi:hypothetical protein
MATKKHAKRYNGDDESMVNAPNRGIVDQTDEEAANEAEMMSSMMRKRAMDEGERDDKAMPKQDFMSSKEPEAPAMRKTTMPKPKPSGVSDTGSKLRAMDNAMAPKKPETLDERRSRRATEFKELLGKRSPMAAARDAMKPKPNFSNEGRSSKAPAPTTPAPKVQTTNVPKAIADFFRPKSAAEKDSASRSALRESEKPKPKAQMGFRERYASQGYASGGSVSASSRADGIATKGKTRGKIC